jgi:GT2 family glycosyltransferase
VINPFFIKDFIKKDEPISKPKVGIVITSYNHIDYTEGALDSFYSTINEKIDHELWLLDDDSFENIESIYNKYKNLGLKFFKNKANAGLTSLWNKGFELNKDKDYLIICNNDVIFSNHWADNLIYTLRNSPSFSVAVPVTNAPGHIPAQHIANFVENYIPNDNQNEINLISEQIRGYNPQKIKKANGFCLAIKVSLLSYNLINGVPFNKKFPLYYGEDEFFSRVKPKTMIVPSSYIFHYKQISVDRKNYPQQQYRPEPSNTITKF